MNESNIKKQYKSQNYILKVFHDTKTNSKIAQYCLFETIKSLLSLCDRIWLIEINTFRNTHLINVSLWQSEVSSCCGIAMLLWDVHPFSNFSNFPLTIRVWLHQGVLSSIDICCDVTSEHLRFRSAFGFWLLVGSLWSWFAMAISIHYGDRDSLWLFLVRYFFGVNTGSCFW